MIKRLKNTCTSFLPVLLSFQVCAQTDTGDRSSQQLSPTPCLATLVTPSSSAITVQPTLQQTPVPYPVSSQNHILPDSDLANWHIPIPAIICSQIDCLILACLSRWQNAEQAGYHHLPLFPEHSSHYLPGVKVFANGISLLSGLCQSIQEAIDDKPGVIMLGQRLQPVLRRPLRYSDIILAWVYMRFFGLNSMPRLRMAFPDVDGLGLLNSVYESISFLFPGAQWAVNNYSGTFNSFVQGLQPFDGSSQVFEQDGATDTITFAVDVEHPEHLVVLHQMAQGNSFMHLPHGRIGDNLNFDYFRRLLQERISLLGLEQSTIRIIRITLRRPAQ